MQQPGEYRLESLYGQEPPPEELVLRGMADLESELTRRFERHHEQQQQARVHQEKVRKPLIDAVRGDPEATEGVRGRKEQAADWRQQYAQLLQRQSVQLTHSSDHRPRAWMGCVVVYDTVAPDPRHKDGSIPLHTAIGFKRGLRYSREVYATQVAASQQRRRHGLDTTPLLAQDALGFFVRLLLHAHLCAVFRTGYNARLMAALTIALRMLLRYSCNQNG